MPGPKDWIKKASGDLRVAKKLVKDDIDDDEALAIAAYLLHQSVEKTLKTIFVYHGKVIPKSHDLELLLEELARLNPFLSVFEKLIVTLISPYESNTRYPDDRLCIDRSEILEGITVAEKVLKVVAQYVHVKI